MLEDTEECMSVYNRVEAEEKKREGRARGQRSSTAEQFGRLKWNVRLRWISSRGTC